jgi:flavodoxin
LEVRGRRSLKGGKSLRSVHLIYFSPTGTTQKVLEAVARGLGAAHIERLDLTRQETTPADIREIRDAFAIIGTPVYAGRVPLKAVEALQLIRARNTPAVVVAVYGNRAYDDALLELADIAKKGGYKTVAAGAFIGEHSFSTLAIAAARSESHLPCSIRGCRNPSRPAAFRSSLQSGGV